MAENLIKAGHDVMGYDGFYYILLTPRLCWLFPSSVDSLRRGYGQIRRKGREGG